MRKNPFVDVPLAIKELTKLHYLDLSETDIPEIHSSSFHVCSSLLCPFKHFLGAYTAQGYLHGANALSVQHPREGFLRTDQLRGTYTLAYPFNTSILGGALVK